MTAIFAKLVTDQVASVVHLYLLALSVFATVCCIKGILWEVGGPLKIHEFARKLVIFGVTFEALFTIALFWFDERISAAQQSKIIALESQRVLSDAQKDRITSAVGTYRLPFVIFSNPETEAWNFALDIGKALKDDGWDWMSCPDPTKALPPSDPRPSVCTVLVDHIEIDAPTKLLPLANSLSDAIREPDTYGMDRVWPDPNKNPSIMTIMVGSKR